MSPKKGWDIGIDGEVDGALAGCATAVLSQKGCILISISIASCYPYFTLTDTEGLGPQLVNYL